jgi:hypothetical protein
MNDSGKRQQVEAINPNVAEMTFSDMPDKHALARIVGRRLSKFAGAGNVAAADVEPIAGEPPIRNVVHGRCLLKPMSALDVQDYYGRAGCHNPNKLDCVQHTTTCSPSRRITTPICCRTPRRTATFIPGSILYSLCIRLGFRF